jgi:hypothetical protein
MRTLNLRMLYPGYYTNTFDDITITVSKGRVSWQLTIEDEKSVLYQSFFDSKKEAMDYGANWVINNL